MEGIKLEDDSVSAVQDVVLQEVSETISSDTNVVEDDVELVDDVEVNLLVKIGGSSITIKELYDMKEGSLLKLDTLTTDPVDILLDKKVVMQGELVVIDDNYGIKILNVNQQ